MNHDIWHQGAGAGLKRITALCDLASTGKPSGHTKRSGAKTGDASQIFRAGTTAHFLATTHAVAEKGHPITHHKGTNASGAAHLVG
jgi:hypothetical protein